MCDHRDLLLCIVLLFSRFCQIFVKNIFLAKIQEWSFGYVLKVVIKKSSLGNLIMAYAQWVSITIVAGKDLTLKIKNANLKWGKFHETGNKEKELSVDEINQFTINPKQYAIINSCGREHAGSGTEGEFDIYDGDVKIGNYYWECPWGKKTNTSRWTPHTLEGYLTSVTGGNLDSGALGNVTIKCVKDGD